MRWRTELAYALKTGLGRLNRYVTELTDQSTWGFRLELALFVFATQTSPAIPARTQSLRFSKTVAHSQTGVQTHLRASLEQRFISIDVFTRPNETLRMHSTTEDVGGVASR